MNKNARFDQMVETMSVVHTNRRSRESRRSGSHDATRSHRSNSSMINAYSPPEPTNVGSELSFIKMGASVAIPAVDQDARPSSPSSNSKAFLVSGTSRTCKTLPSWLANTFMTLSKKHPLRLLLPKDTTENVIAAQSDDDAPAAVAGLYSYLPEAQMHPSSPNLRKIQKLDEPLFHPTTLSERPLFPQFSDTMDNANSSALSPTTFLSLNRGPGSLLGPAASCHTTAQVAHDDDDFLTSSTGPPLPFSTLGPGSLLGSTVLSNTIFSTSSPKTCSSPTQYCSETHFSPDLHPLVPYAPAYTSDYAYSAKALDRDNFYENLTTDEFNLDLRLAEPACDPVLVDIYSTPGPDYCAPRPIYFDSPSHDPMSSDPMQPGFEIDYSDLDFRWEPFHLKKIAVPGVVQPTAFARDMSITCNAPPPPQPETTASPVKPGRKPSIEYSGIKENVAHKHTSQAYASPPMPAVSPSPFRFTLPPGGDDATSVNPESMEQPNKLSAPKKPLCFAVPGIYISPLRESQKTPSPKYVSSNKPSVLANDKFDDDDGWNPSLLSDDSIESWNDDI
ncbi:hypothetical protein B0H34DRAFT_806439 [Crassisporium funariophilum]|nr:hypothetical protein B0H34DRAFT_806439 [Crassisporium funariophilum]